MPDSTTCPQCGKTSYNRGDIENRYCKNCSQFYDEMPNLPPGYVISEMRAYARGERGSLSKELLLKWADTFESAVQPCCIHGHIVRVVGCVSCVLVFDKK